MGIPSHTPGEIRYCTYYLIFPGDKDVWVDQTPIVHDLQFWLKNTSFGKDPLKARDILNKGETKWKDNNGVTHRIVIEKTKRNRAWGNKRQVH